MSTKSDFSRRWGRASRGEMGVLGGRGSPRGAGGESVPGREPRSAPLCSGRLGMGWGKTFLLPGDDVKTPGLQRRMGWEAGRPRWSGRVGMGLGCGVGAESASVRSGAGGQGAGDGRRNPRFPALGKWSSQYGNWSWGWATPVRVLHPHRDAAAGDSTSPGSPKAPPPWAGTGRFPAPLGSRLGTLLLGPAARDGGTSTWRSPPQSSEKWESHGEGWEARPGRQAGAWWHVGVLRVRAHKAIFPSLYLQGHEK